MAYLRLSSAEFTKEFSDGACFYTATEKRVEIRKAMGIRAFRSAVCSSEERMRKRDFNGDYSCAARNDFQKEARRGRRAPTCHVTKYYKDITVER